MHIKQQSLYHKFSNFRIHIRCSFLYIVQRTFKIIQKLEVETLHLYYSCIYISYTFQRSSSIQWWLNMNYLLNHPFESQTAWKQILSLPALDFQTFIYKAGRRGPSSSTNKYCIFMFILSFLLTWDNYIKFLCTYSLSIFLLLH